MTFEPFSEYDSSTFRIWLSELKDEITSLSNEYVLGCSPAELENAFISKGQVEPLELHVDQKWMENPVAIKFDVSHDHRRMFLPGHRPEVPGTGLIVVLPFKGDSRLWKIQPRTYGMTYPLIDLSEGDVRLRFTFADDSANPDQINARIESDLKALQEGVRVINQDVDVHNNQVIEEVQAQIERKRARALTAVNAVAALGIPMKRRDAPLTYVAPIQRLPTPVRPPIVPTQPYSPDPTLEEAEYQHILKVLRSMSLVMERSRKSFRDLPEEWIRDHFLIQLNGHYEGCATGETFNGEGDSDILIRVGDRNIFIGECKFWDGSRKFDATISQLFDRYLT